VAVVSGIASFSIRGKNNPNAKKPARKYKANSPSKIFTAKLLWNPLALKVLSHECFKRVIRCILDIRLIFLRCENSKNITFAKFFL
jgi:hypothetical protein